MQAEHSKALANRDAEFAKLPHEMASVGCGRPESRPTARSIVAGLRGGPVRVHSASQRRLQSARPAASVEPLANRTDHDTMCLKARARAFWTTKVDKLGLHSNIVIAKFLLLIIDLISLYLFPVSLLFIPIRT